MANLARLVSVPPKNSVNQGLSSLRSSTMLRLIGTPGERVRGRRCGKPTNSKLRSLLETRSIANLQFPLRMPHQVLDLLEEVFDDVKREDEELFEKARTNGSFCVRPIGSSGKFSNHAWGCAVDLGFGPESQGGFIRADTQNDDRTEIGLLRLVPFFNRHKFFWGGTFGREDSMHFEVSEQLANSLFGNGGPVSSSVTFPGGGPSGSTLKHPSLSSDRGLREVAAGSRVLQRSGVPRESVGVLQDALNSLGKQPFRVAFGAAQSGRQFFGPKTETAVKNFQRDNGIDVDGIVGQDTIAKLDQRLIDKDGAGRLQHILFRNQPVLQAVEAGNLILERSGTPVEGVGEIQDALNLLAKKNTAFKINLGPNDKFRSFFGPKTEASVKAFQKSSDIPPDGRVGSETIKALDKALMNAGSSVTVDSPITGPGGYRPPEAVRAQLGTIPLSDGQELDPLDFLIDRDQVEILMKLPNGAVFFEAGMQSDADGSPRALEIDRFGQLETSFRFSNETGQSKFPDAEKVNYFVLPGPNQPTSQRFFNRMGIKLGDVAAILREGHLEFAFFADVGPTRKLGEGSVNLVQSLGVNPFINGRVRRGIPDEVVYIVFPGSRPATLTPSNVTEKVETIGKKLFRDLGGIID